MGYWNYRICQYADGTSSLNEVFCGDGGKETSMTAEAICFVADAVEGSEGIIKSLEMALRDARERPVLKAPQRWEESGDETHFALDGDDTGVVVSLNGGTVRIATANGMFQAMAEAGLTVGARVRVVDGVAREGVTPTGTYPV